MKQRANAKTRFTAWLLCAAMLLALLPVTAWAADAEYEDITPADWALSITAWDGWAVGYTAANYSDGVLSATVTKEKDWNAAHRIISPALDTAIENVEAIDITISFEHSTDSSGDVCLQLDVNKGIDGATESKDGWGKVDGSNPTLSADTKTYRFVRLSNNTDSLKQLSLYFYVGNDWNGEFTGTAKISEIKVYKTVSGGGEVDPPAQEYTITTESWVNGNHSAGSDCFAPQSAKVTHMNQEFVIDSTRWSNPLNSVVMIVGEQETKLSTTKQDDSHEKVTIDTTDINSDITLRAIYGSSSSENPDPPDSEYTITTANPFMRENQAGDYATNVYSSVPTKVTNGEQTFNLKLKEWGGDDGSYFAPDSIIATKADGTDVSSDIKLKLDKSTGKVTFDTTNVDYNIIFTAKYLWTSGTSAPDPDTNIIKAVFIGGGERQDYENLEAMAPYKVEYTPGDKLVFKVATTLWGGFPLDKITASLADGTDITGKLTIEDGESGFKNVTVDTTGITGGIELLATYSSSWNSGGSGGGGGGNPVIQNPGGSTGSNSSVVPAGSVVTAIRAESIGGVLTTEVTREVMDKLIEQVEKSKE